jgi:hypothetical protein
MEKPFISGTWLLLSGQNSHWGTIVTIRKRPSNDQPTNHLTTGTWIVASLTSSLSSGTNNLPTGTNPSIIGRNRLPSGTGYLRKGAKHLSSVRNSARSHAATLPITSNNYCCKCKNTQKVRTCPNHPPNFLSDKCSEPTHPFQRLKPNTLSE